MAADEMEAGIADKSSGQQTALAQDLKAIANAENELARCGKFFDRSHHWRKPRQSPRTQIIPIRKPARDDDRIKTAKVGFLVPNKIYRLANML
jgi:hypothetical protein